MDQHLRNLIHQYHAHPGDESVRGMLNAALKRAKLPSLQQVENIRLIAKEILACRESVCMRCGMGGRCSCASAGFGDNTVSDPPVKPHLRELALESINLPVGVHLRHEHLGVEIAEGVYTKMPIPSFPADRTALVHPDAYDAALMEGGCPYCLQYLLGCRCGTDPEQEPYPALCPNCNEHLRRSNNYVGFTCGCPTCAYCHQQPCQCDWGYQFIGGGYAVSNHPDPSMCPCHGGGWLISDMDSVHRCNLHPVTSHHPDCGNPDPGSDPQGCCTGF